MLRQEQRVRQAALGYEKSDCLLEETHCLTLRLFMDK